MALPLHVEPLDNGLTVILAENHHLPKVFGAVAVRAGSKHDPEHHTGMAHYLEHMLFKGTQRLGTIDYAAERPYLDSIAFWYERLAKAKADAERTRILRTINRLSLKAAEYAIPNELDRLLDYGGARHINAFTHFDKTVFHNAFPPHQMERWLDIYAHRFMHPVFRLFQSELEVVYEEKNRMMDDFSYFIMDAFFRNFFRRHPYRRPIIGETEHLRRPSLVEMYRYFYTYYRPANMALVLVGDFSVADVMPRIRRKFGRWRPAPVPRFTPPPEPPLHGRNVVKLRVSPIRMGLMAFRTAPDPHPDAPVLRLIARLLSNENGTGLFDDLVREGRLLAASPFTFLLQDHGAFGISFAPKLVGQWFSTAEKHILRQLDRLKNGDYPLELFESVRLELRRLHEMKYESNQRIALELIDAFIYNVPPEQFLHRAEVYEHLRPEDVARIARKYFGENYLLIQSRKGKPRKEKLPKPPFDPIQKTARGAESEYARYYKQLPELPFTPNFIDFSAATPRHSTARYELYFTPNDINGIAQLTFSWRVGKLHDPLLPYVTDYLGLAGAQRYPGAQLGMRLGSLGFGYELSTSDNYVTLTLTGPDERLPEAVETAFEWLRRPHHAPEMLDVIYKQAEAAYQSLFHDPADVAKIIKEYVIHGDYSRYLQQLPLRALRSLTVETLMAHWKEAFHRPFELHYVGRRPVDELARIVDAVTADLPAPEPPAPFQERPRRAADHDAVYYAPRPDAIQSHLYIYVPGPPFTPEQLTGAVLFNRYFGADMSSVMFQELREFRSLAYAAGGTLQIPAMANAAAWFLGYIGTQADKTVEALETIHRLIRRLPVDSHRIGEVAAAERNAVLMQTPSIRRRSMYALAWRRRGWRDDPARTLWKELSDADLPMLQRRMMDVYVQYLQSRPVVFMGVVDPARSEVERLARQWPLKPLDPQKLVRT